MYLGRVVEIGPTEALFTAPGHPYTQALIVAVPDAVPGQRRVHPAVQGELPSNLLLPPGCPFHPRCPRAEAVCYTERPALMSRNQDWPVACHFG